MSWQVMYMYSVNVKTQPELCGFICVCSDFVYALMVHTRTQLGILTFSMASEKLNVVTGTTRSFLC